MNQKIPFHDLSARVAVATGISSESAEQFVKSFFDLLAEAVTSGESVRVKGLGSFNVVNTEGEKNIEFIPDKEITDVINAPFAIFEAVELDEKLSDEMLDEVDREARENHPVTQEQSTIIENDDPEIGESEQHESDTQGQAEITDVEPTVRPEQIQEPEVEAEEISSDEDHAVEDEPTPSATTIVEEETVVENEPENELDSSLAMTSNIEEELVSEETETRDNDTPQESTEEVEIENKIEEKVIETATAVAPIVEEIKDETETVTEIPTEPQSSVNVSSPIPVETLREATTVTTSEAETIAIPEPVKEPATEPISTPQPKPVTPFEDDEEEYVRPAAPANSGGGGHFWSGLIIGLIVGIALGACGVYLAINYFFPTVATATVVEGESEEAFEDPLLDAMLADTVNYEVEPTAQVNEQTQATPDTIVEIPAEQQQPAVVPTSQPEETPKPAAPVKDTIRQGYVMPNMAKKFYGNKDFWVYIYEENKANIANPNNLPPGKVLVIPPAEKYGIDANNPESLKKARAKAAEILKKYPH